MLTFWACISRSSRARYVEREEHVSNDTNTTQGAWLQQPRIRCQHEICTVHAVETRSQWWRIQAYNATRATTRHSHPMWRVLCGQATDGVGVVSGRHQSFGCGVGLSKVKRCGGVRCVAACRVWPEVVCLDWPIGGGRVESSFQRDSAQAKNARPAQTKARTTVAGGEPPRKM